MRHFRGFNDLFMGYRPMLIGMLRKLLRDRPDEVDDVLQETWIKGAKAWPPKDPASARSWLGRIAINEALGSRRRSRRHPHASVDHLRMGEPADPRPSPDEHAAHSELHAFIDALERRIPVQIAALRLVRLEGYTYTEAAHMLGSAEGTVKSNVFRATEHLRIALNAPKAA